ncbi:hypothetical protein D3C76_1633560 [compost metagenome]
MPVNRPHNNEIRPFIVNVIVIIGDSVIIACWPVIFMVMAKLEEYNIPRPDPVFKLVKMRHTAVVV